MELKCQTRLKKNKVWHRTKVLSEKKTDKVIKCQNGVRQKISRQDWNCGHSTELQKWYTTMYVSNSIQWLYNSTNVRVVGILYIIS